MVVYFEREGTIYRRLVADDAGIWVIAYLNPKAPFRISHQEAIAIQRILPPEDMRTIDPPGKKAMEAKEKRLQTLMPLIEDDGYIVSSKRRNAVVKAIAGQCGLTERTVFQWYYDYLAGGEMRLCPKPRQLPKKSLTDDQKNIRWAINKYYYSSRRMSLRSAYDMMLLGRYTSEEGKLMDCYPTFQQFRYFYYSKANNPVKKVISREGIGEYQRNYRPLYGSASTGKDKIGVYQLDATIADIYLVSRHNRKQIIGRPYVYLAVDTATRLIAGIYIGLEAGDVAVTECLRQAAGDKVAFCRRYGVEIQAEEWPSKGLPTEIVTDRGREFIGRRMDEVCAQYGIVSTGLPPYRPDLKGLVENTLHALQERYKYVLKHMGVIEADFQERGAVDYRREATLNLHEFTQVMIHAILYYNAKHIQQGYIRNAQMAEDEVKPIAADLWQWYTENGGDALISLEEGEECTLLPRAVGYFTRRGLTFRHLAYKNKEFNTRCAAAGLNGKEEVQIAYEPQNTDVIYLIENGAYIPFTITSAKAQFQSSSFEDVQRFLEQERRVKKAVEQEDTAGRVAVARSIKAIAAAALLERGELHSMEAVAAIEEQREQERRMDVL